MMRRLSIAFALCAIVAAAAWLGLRREEERDGTQVDASRPAATAMAPRAQPTAPAVAAPSTAASPARDAVKPASKKPLFNEYLASRQYQTLYERLHDSPEGRTPQGRLVLYEILRECGTVTGGVPWPFNPRRGNTPKRDDFVAGLPPTDPQRERRIAAYDAFTTDRCQGFGNVTLSQDELLALLRDSAAGGEPAARALVIEQDLWAARRSSGTRTASPSDAQLEALKDAVSTRDPEAIRVAGRVLANGWSDFALRTGADDLPVEPRPFVNAWLVLACEYGAPCGADTPRMQQACALQGHCDAQSFPDYLAYYASTPYDSTLLMQYRGLVRTAIETGDWSQLHVVRGQAPTTNRPTFIPGPR
jgi:hypothetical protein